MSSWLSRALRSHLVRRALLATAGLYVRRRMHAVRSSIASGRVRSDGATTSRWRWPLLVAAAAAAGWFVYRRTRRAPSTEDQWATLDAAAADGDGPAHADGDGLAPDVDLAAGEALIGQPLSPGDLKVVEGIGPKIEQVLNDSGIATWHDLAVADVDRLRDILSAAGTRYRLHDPTDWPTQAALLGRGDWQAFAERTGRTDQTSRG